jgi:hypothetical protein
MWRVLPIYLGASRWLLAATSVTKLYSSMGNARVLDIPEALLPMSIRQTLWLVGAIELLIALHLWRGKSDFTKLVMTAWLGGNFILYRVAALLLIVGKPCPCLGSVTEKIPLKPATIDHVLAGIAVYLFAGSVALLVTMRKQTRGNTDTATGERGTIEGVSDANIGTAP